MNSGLITLNILGHDDRTFEMVRLLNPRYVVSTATGMGGHTAAIQRLLRENPGLTVIARGVFHNGDSLDKFPEYWDKYGGFASADHFLAKARWWMSRIGPQYRDRVLIHGFNETGGRTDGPSPTFREWIEWHSYLEVAGRAEGLAFCHLNYHLGYPEFEGEDQYPLHAPLLEAMKGGRSVIGMHEYYYQPRFDSPDNLPWIIGRYKRLYDACPGCDEVPVVMTEWGEARGWMDIPVPEAETAQELSECARWYQHDPRVQGLAFFCINGWPPWDKNHDIAGSELIQRTLINSQVQIQDQEEPPVEPPVVTPCSQPIPKLTVPGGKFRCTSDVGVKKRAYPAADDCAIRVGGIAEDEVVEFVGFFHDESYVWGLNKEDGSWSAVGATGIQWFEPVETVEVERTVLTDIAAQFRKLAVDADQLSFYADKMADKVDELLEE